MERGAAAGGETGSTSSTKRSESGIGPMTATAMLALASSLAGHSPVGGVQEDLPRMLVRHKSDDRERVRPARKVG